MSLRLRAQFENLKEREDSQNSPITTPTDLWSCSVKVIPSDFWYLMMDESADRVTTHVHLTSNGHEHASGLFSVGFRFL